MTVIASDNKRVIVGLGQTGLSLARHLTRLGLSFTVADSRQQPPGLVEFEQAFPGVALQLGPFSDDQFVDATELLINPGIPLSTPAIAAAQRAGVKISGDIDYFRAATDTPLVAITGSNGKSTVTTLVGAMAKQAGLKVAVGGNLGTPALDLLDDSVDLYVLELSSFQLERCDNLAAMVATVLNVSEDHLDHHGSMVAYHQAKHRIFRGCKKVVINRDDSLSSPLIPDDVECWSFRLGRSDIRGYGLLEMGGREHIALAGDALMAVSELKIVGRHNLANSLAALALGSAAGLPRETMLPALRNFSGLPHRCEFVRRWQAMDFYNDSKGTNVGAAQAAIEGLAPRGKVVLIAGGQGKGADFTALANALVSHGRGAVLLGEDAALINQAIAGRLPVVTVASMDEAVRAAVRLAQPGDQVLLSPACASFDMFKGFAHRGEVFSQAVMALGEASGQAGEDADA